MKTQGTQDFEGLLSEANGKRSRDVGVITGGNYPSGTVLGQITASKKFTQLDPSASDGSEDAAAVLGANVDALAADHTGVIFQRDVEWSESLLAFEASVTTPEKTAALAQLAGKGVIARTDEDS